MQKAAGFTLTELLIVMALVAILVSIATPGFGALTRANRVLVATNELTNLLIYARSEALTRGLNVSVEAPGINNWSGALKVTTASSTVTGGVETLRTFEGTGLAPSGLNSTGTATRLTFRPNGTLASAFTIRLCATNDRSTPGKVLTVTQGGHTEVADFTPTSVSTGCS